MMEFDDRVENAMNEMVASLPEEMIRDLVPEVYASQAWEAYVETDDTLASPEARERWIEVAASLVAAWQANISKE